MISLTSIQLEVMMVRTCVLWLLISGLSVTAPAASAQTASPVDAAEIYKQRCAMCHGAEGDALVPNQNFADSDWKRGSTLKQVIEVIRNGVREPT